MAPVLYALASDTLVAVIRAWSIARQRELAEDLADDDGSPLAILGGVLLWLLRLALAPPSTIKGFRGWVVDEVRVAPGRTAGQVAAPAQVLALGACAAAEARRWPWRDQDGSVPGPRPAEARPPGGAAAGERVPRLL